MHVEPGAAFPRHDITFMKRPDGRHMGEAAPSSMIQDELDCCDFRFWGVAALAVCRFSMTYLKAVMDTNNLSVFQLSVCT